jgi:3-deoxy-D-manno-octulosonic-acid transferase
MDSIKVKTARYTSASDPSIKDAEVLIIDIIGILSSVYKYGKIAYIGGGFGKGIHNILEAATFGLPVIFGPNFKKFREANDLVNLKGAFSIEDYHGLSEIIRALISDQQLFIETGDSARRYVLSNLGATDTITNFVLTPV